MERLRCVVERITYQNEKNGYSVLKCRAKEYRDLVTVVGTMPEIHAGSVLSLTGIWKVDPKFGRQFAAETVEEILPATVYGIEKYLGSGLVKGIGPKFAKRIVNAFGEDTLRVIEEQPEELLQVNGIGYLRVDKIKKSWAEQKEIRNIMLFLQSHDVSTSHASKIYKTYGDQSLSVVKENPYRLADDIWGIGFHTADGIAQKLGFEKSMPVRLRSGLLYAIKKISEEGHCFATKAQLLNEAAELLEVTAEQLDPVLEALIASEDVKTELIPDTDETGIYLPPFYFSEAATAKRLREIFSAPKKTAVRTDGLAESICQKTGMAYDEIQMKAILTAVSSKILILTGGPGTGKTSTTLGIITAFREAGAKILLAAPTGRAAKRLSEATGVEAKTIHRLLEVKPPDGYQRNENNPLEGDVMIVDECSMIDLLLMHNLLKAIPDTMTLILVGDIDQLPSVGAGNVLRDMIDSRCFPVVRLTRIFRQAQTSRIITNAHRINRGQMPDLSNGRESDFFFLEQENPEEAAKEIVNLVRNRLPSHYRVPGSKIQVLSPMQRGAVGAANLNLLLQEAVNPGEICLRRGGFRFKTRDKVMQIRNNYEKEVFNGDIGIIESIQPEDGELTVNFEGKRVSYDTAELDELVLAYAVTIHKSQGSEYPIVVMPILMSHYVMLQRNLVYTGVTRAKKVLVIVGTKKALALAVRNSTVRKRNTLLAERIRRSFEMGGSQWMQDMQF